LSHSHIPVKHLLKQLEIYRLNRQNRDIRPPWLTDLIGRLSELFDPVGDVARVGFECRLGEEAWELLLFLGSTEIVGGPEDGQTRLMNFRMDLRAVLDHFTEVEAVAWHAHPQTPRDDHDDEDAGDSSLQIRGRVEDEALNLMIFSAPPAGVGPGIREHQNGQVEPV